MWQGEIGGIHIASMTYVYSVLVLYKLQFLCFTINIILVLFFYHHIYRSLRIMLPPANMGRLIRSHWTCLHCWMRAEYVAGSDLLALLGAPCSTLRVVLHYPALSSGSLLGPIQCPVKHNYYSVCIFFSIQSLWNMVSTRVLFIVWNWGYGLWAHRVSEVC